MKLITEYLSTKIKPSIIKATNVTIRRIVKDELDRLGIDADLNHIDVRNVDSMDFLFAWSSNPILEKKYADLNPDISKWDVSNVNNMERMFRCCANFDCDISGWNVGKVENMYQMFWGCENFNQDLSEWDVSKVRTYYGIFDKCHIKEEFKPYW